DAPAAEAAPAAKVPSAPQPSPQASSAVPDDQVWSVNLSETDSRDMTTQQIVEAWATGVVTDDAYIYKPGFDDWKPLLEVPELAALLSPAAGGGDAAASVPVTSRAASGRAATSGRSGDLFGGLAAAGSENDPGLAAPHAVPAADSL